MLYGHLPFWGESEDEFIEKIISAPLRFDADVAVTPLCKEMLKGLLQKDPERRTMLVELMGMPYYTTEEEDLEESFKKAEQDLEQSRKQEEQKQEKQSEDDLLSGLNLNVISDKGVSTGKAGKSPSKIKDKTPVSGGNKSGNFTGTSGSSIKSKKASAPAGGSKSGVAGSKSTAAKKSN